jgi:hypothetical protein
MSLRIAAFLRCEGPAFEGRASQASGPLPTRTASLNNMRHNNMSISHRKCARFCTFPELCDGLCSREWF